MWTVRALAHASNRDEFVVIRKMSKVDWLEEPLAASGIPVAQEV